MIYSFINETKELMGSRLRFYIDSKKPIEAYKKPIETYKKPITLTIHSNQKSHTNSNTAPLHAPHSKPFDFWV